MKWRRLNHIIHRDVGYFFLGLTIIYGVSGIAVNHISHDFNPSYTIERTQGAVPPLAAGQQPDNQYATLVLETLAIDEPVKNAAMISPQSIRIFTESYTIDVDLVSGRALREEVRKIPVLYQLNYLHLNKGKGIWTWIADIYGFALLLLATTGFLMIRGHTRVRGLLLAAAGVALPVVYLLFI